MSHLLEKAVFVTLFMFTLCYLFFVWSVVLKKIYQTKKPVQILLTFSTLFLLPDEK